MHTIIERSPDLPDAPDALAAVCRTIGKGRGFVEHDGRRVTWTVGSQKLELDVRTEDGRQQWTGTLDGQPCCYIDTEADLSKAARLLTRESAVEHFAPTSNARSV